MKNPELTNFMAQHLANIDYALRELRQTYLLTGLADLAVDKRLERAGEEIEIAHLL